VPRPPRARPAARRAARRPAHHEREVPCPARHAPALPQPRDRVEVRREEVGGVEVRASKAAASRPAAPRSAAPKSAATQAAASAPAPKALTILYVHGIGNKPVPSLLKCQWDHALFGFDLGERSRLAYWVNREYYPRPESATCKSGDLVSLEEEPTGEGLSVKQHVQTVTLAQEARAIAPDDAGAQAFLAAVGARVEASAEGRAARVEAAHASGRPLGARDVAGGAGARGVEAQGAEARTIDAKILPLPGSRGGGSPAG
jgi:hypothetical protein